MKAGFPQQLKETGTTSTFLPANDMDLDVGELAGTQTRASESRASPLSPSCRPVFVGNYYDGPCVLRVFGLTNKALS